MIGCVGFYVCNLIIGDWICCCRRMIICDWSFDLLGVVVGCWCVVDCDLLVNLWVGCLVSFNWRYVRDYWLYCLVLFENWCLVMELIEKRFGICIFKGSCGEEN